MNFVHAPQLLELKKKLIPYIKKSPSFSSDLIIFALLKKEGILIPSLSTLYLQHPLPLDPIKLERDAIKIAQQHGDGTPLQYLLGFQHFLAHDYYVNESVLIPRPETEILASTALQWITDEIASKFIPADFIFYELGLGSGILSCEILSAFPLARGIASEISSDAITVAQQNLNLIVPDWENRFKILESVNAVSPGFEVFVPHGSAHVIISNPPYLSRNDEIEDAVARFEPQIALFPTLASEDEDPNYFYKNFIEYSLQILKPNGAAFFEIPHERSQKLLAEFKDNGFLDTVLINDLTGRPRVLHCERGVSE